MPTITFRRASNVQNIPITDGQIIFDTARNIILMDNGNVRNQYAGATQLISTTPEATNTNAFNALASTQLFLQKTTVIDTKANALAVNQNYIPLGCLAFKEALGTTNYSSVGNGTISGALVTLNNKSNQLDTKLTNQLSVNNNEFYFDYQNGKYGYNTDPNRGADTFNPFNQGWNTGDSVCVGSICGYNSGAKIVCPDDGMSFNIIAVGSRYGGYVSTATVKKNGTTIFSWTPTDDGGGNYHSSTQMKSGSFTANKGDIITAYSGGGAVHMQDVSVIVYATMP